MRSLQAQPVELNIFRTAAILGIVAMFAGILLYEPLFFLVPIAFLFAYQLILNFKTIFYLLLIVTPASIEYYSPTGFSTTLPTEPIMLVFMLTFIFYVFLKQELFDRAFISHPLTIILFIHFGWLMITTLFSADIVISLKYLLAKTWFIITFYFIGALVVKNIKDFKIVFWCLFTPTLLLVLFTLNNHMHYQFRFSEVNKTMVPFFRNHVNYAVFLALTFPFLFIASTWYKKYTWQKMVINLGKLLFLLAIYFSYTRSSWLSVAGALVAYFLIRYNKLLPAAGVLIMVVIAFVIYMLHNNKYMDYAPDYTKTIYHTHFSEHMESTMSLEDVSSAERIYRWVAAVHMIEERPYLGFGPGQFYFNYKEYTINKFETYISRNPERSTVHNYYLQVTVEQGFIGLTIWVVLLVYILYLGQKLYNRFTDKQYKYLAMVLTLSIITIIVNIALSDLIEADKIGTMFFMMMAILVNLDLMLKRNSDHPSTEFLR
ncbi:MAG: O-antigen ligase family protein [Chitinophagales bacterium]|nr:O-antigen ligase family protein [Bacteroidota bacterium]MBP8915112.1 O-antigen ligase family protein [Chitinophagales bacterium]MBP9219795.1 O-antigen ligase family protein [Chitinophagales bacterium]MBP9795172.1 O-antigen ligase family protein [Chitinophagales bacterium]